MSRSGSILFALMIIAGASSSVVAEPASAERPWAISAGLAAGPVTLRDDVLDEPSGGFGYGVVARVGYVGSFGLGVVADLSLWTTQFGSCEADGPCVDERADRFGVLTASLRWRATSRLYLQAGGGVSHTRHSADWGAEVWNSPVVTAAIGWRRPIPDGFIEFELRGNGFRNDSTLVTQIVGVVALGHAW